MILKDSDIIDLVAGTLKELGRMKFQQIAQELQDYEVMPRWLKNDRVMFDSGIGIQRTLMYKQTRGARHVGLFQKDVVNVASVIKQMNIGWVHATNNWAFERRETLMNKGSALVFKVVEPRRVDCMLGLAEELEEKAWSLPAVDNEVDPFGIPYWIVKNSSEGFNGGAPSGHTTVAGVNPTSVPKWKNYTNTYINVTKLDLIKKLRTAYRKIGWKSPVSVQDYREGRGDTFRLYMNEVTLNAIELLGESQNDNLGNDIASKDDTIVFKKHPCVWIPYLDADTQYPVYMINHSCFNPVVLEGDYLRETEPAKSADSHNTFEVFVDLSYNYICIDRRRNAVLYIA
jgi:hypothetical protein